MKFKVDDMVKSAMHEYAVFKVERFSGAQIFCKNELFYGYFYECDLELIEEPQEDTISINTVQEIIEKEGSYCGSKRIDTTTKEEEYECDKGHIYGTYCVKCLVLKKIEEWENRVKCLEDRMEECFPSIK